MSEDIQTDMKAVLKRLRLSKLLDTIPQRLALAKQQKMGHAEFLLLVCERQLRSGQI